MSTVDTAPRSTDSLSGIAAVLGEDAGYLLEHECRAIRKEKLHLPRPDFVDAVWMQSDRNPKVLSSIQRLFEKGRLGGTGYLSILPFDQSVEHGAGSMFVTNPDYFDPDNILTLAYEGGCNGIATSFGLLGTVARKWAHKLPLILKINHNEQLTYPQTFDHVMFAQVEDAWNMGCVGVSATVFFGSQESTRQLTEVTRAFARAHELGMLTILHCYLWNDAFTVNGVNHHFSADVTGQANHLGATIEADFVKQKQPLHNGGYRDLNPRSNGYGKFDARIYTELSTDHPIDLTRYQVINGYAGRVGLINSGGESGTDDLREAVRTAVINKRAGGMGLLLGRKAFQRPLEEGIRLLNAVQDVYLCPEVTIA